MKLSRPGSFTTRSSRQTGMSPVSFMLLQTVSPESTYK